MHYKMVSMAVAILSMAVGSPAATEKVLHTFVDTSTNENGGPISGMTEDADGNVYGTTFGVGTCSIGCGEVFKLARSSSGGFTFEVIHRFAGAQKEDGENPYGAPILDSDVPENAILPSQFLCEASTGNSRKAQRHQQSRNPRFIAMVTACVRSLAPSLESMLFMCAFTVASETARRAAIIFDPRSHLTHRNPAV
jgi:hypothetical protein